MYVKREERYQGKVICGGSAEQFVEVVVLAEIGEVYEEELRVLDEALSVEEDVGLILARIAPDELLELAEDGVAARPLLGVSAAAVAAAGELRLVAVEDRALVPA